ncbi:MAG: transcriptional regulator, AraC family [Pseudomonadota bacterium]
MVQLQPLVFAANKLGLDSARIFGQLGLRLEDIANTNARFRASLEFDIWNALELASGDPCIGVRMGDLIEVGALGAYDYMLRNCATLRAAITTADRYMRVVDDLTRISVIDEGATSRVRLWRIGDYPMPGHGIECTFLAIVRFIGDANPNVVAREMRFSHRMTGALEERTRRFKCPVIFEQAHAECVLAAEALDLPNPRADPRLGQVLEEHVRNMLASLPAEDALMHRARLSLATLLRAQNASLETLADELHMSARTLRRRLEEHGSSYRALLDELRAQLADHYVARTDQSFEQIAARLGFTEPSTFYRAFKRWLGTTPAAYRVDGGRGNGNK